MNLAVCFSGWGRFDPDTALQAVSVTTFESVVTMKRNTRRHFAGAALREAVKN